MLDTKKVDKKDQPYTSKKEQRRQEGELNRNRLKELRKIRDREVSAGLLDEIIKYFLKFKEDYERLDPKMYYDCHHTIPRAATKVIYKKLENGEFTLEQVNKLKTVNSKYTKKICKLYHRNFNQLFWGNCLLTDVIKKMETVMFGANHRVKSIGDKECILEFMFFVAYHNGKSVDVENISLEVGREDYIIPRDLLEYFGIDRKDIMNYLADNFFYPDYEQYWEVWTFLKENGIKNVSRMAEPENEVAVASAS